VSAPDVVLGISTAGPVEVAVLGGQSDAARSSDGGALESLVLLVSQALADANTTIGGIALIGVCTGPGSFTGLRIGVAFAKTLAQTRAIPIVGVSSYDVAALDVGSFPMMSVARGKRDYYYARIMTSRDSAPRFIQGSHEIIKHAAAEAGSPGKPATIVGPDFSSTKPGDAARAVARLARQAQSAANLDWTNIVIDYGQRPNAVMNWEKRHRAAEEGPPLSRRED
jgi:tRNA threonylcarbamoyladenosine biosynthesis protein TsaB